MDEPTKAAYDRLVKELEALNASLFSEPPLMKRVRVNNVMKARDAYIRAISPSRNEAVEGWTEESLLTLRKII